MNQLRVLPFLLLALLPGCGGCGKMSPKEFYSDPDEIALAKAAQRGDVKTIDRLVDKGVDVNAKGKDDVTPLLFALEARRKKSFLRLLEHGADPNIQNSRGKSVTSRSASVEDDSAWLEMVLKHKGNPNLVSKVDDKIVGHQTPLFNAIDSRNIKNIELLIKAGADLNHQSQTGNTPAIYAAGLRQFECIYMFLQAGADWKIKRANGIDLAYSCLNSPVDEKAFPETHQYRQKVLEFLRQKGVDLEAVQKEVDKDMKAMRGE